MEEIFERLRTRLTEKRDNLNDWLQASPAGKKGVLLGDYEETAVGEHIHSIEGSIEKADAGELGICTICHEPVETGLLEMDYTASVCLEHLSGEEAVQLEDELELAKSVQKSLLPQQSPAIEGLEIAAFSRPAQFVGGDYFDFLTFDGGFPGLVIADVAGHGVSASLQMAGLQALTRAILPVSQSASEAVSHIHRLFIHNILFTTFVTFFLGAYDAAARRLSYCNAGHNPPLLVRRNADGSLSEGWLKPTGPAIGLIEDTSFVEQTVQLEPGDALILYTDGVIEAENGTRDFYGSERLMHVLRENHPLSSGEVMAAIRESLKGFAADKPLTDDTTFVVCKVL